MNNKTILFTFVILLFIFLSTVLVYKYFKSNLESFAGSNSFSGYSNQGGSNMTDSIWEYITHFTRIPHPSNDDKEIRLFKFTKNPNSKVTYKRLEESTLIGKKSDDISHLNKELTFGCFFTNENIQEFEFDKPGGLPNEFDPDDEATKFELGQIDKLVYFNYDDEAIENTSTQYNDTHFNATRPFIDIKGVTIDSTSGKRNHVSIFEISIKNPGGQTKAFNELEVNYKDEPLFKTSDKNINIIKFKNIRGLSFISISLKNNRKTYIPELHINLNNQHYIHKFKKNKLNFDFPIDKIIVSNFNGFVGHFRFLNRVYDTNDFCNTFNCDIPCFEPQSKYIDNPQNKKPVSSKVEGKELNDNYVEFNGDVNQCIKHCMKTCNNIEKCQKICINCEVDGQTWTDDQKALRCPWLKEIKIQGATIPDAPVIRGFPGDGSILVEWKKPFDGRNDITNYIVLFYESFNKKNGIQVSISGKSDTDICEYEIKNLKNKTHYDIIIRAVNNKGIGKPSNIITVSPNGQVIANTNQHIFNELDDELNKKVNKIPLDFTCGLTNYDSVGHTLDYYNEADINIKDAILDSKKLSLDTPGERVKVKLTEEDIDELSSSRVNMTVFGTVLEYVDEDKKVSILIDGNSEPNLIHISNISKI